MDEYILELENIKKTYDGKRYVLDDLSLSIKKGKMVVIIGKSGAGKSTLLNILGLLDVFNQGNYRLDGIEIDSKKHNSYSDFREKYIGFVFQSYHLIDSISVQDNILLPFLYGKEKIGPSIIDRMNGILKDFDLSELKNKKVSLLSGGEKQRVAIARAIIKNPPIIIADEPTGNLDEENSRVVIKHLTALAKSNVTVILVTHDMKLLKYADETYMLEEGRLLKYENE